VTKPIALALTLFALQQAPVTLPQELRRALDRQLESVVQQLDGVIGYAAMDLTSGEEIGRLEDREFPTASTIKLAILYELFKQADAGKLRIDSSAPLDRQHAVGGSGILNALGTPTLSLRDHAVLMMAISDNTATNVLIDRVGLASVSARMESIDLRTVKLRRRMMDAAAAARGDENVAAPRDIVRLMRVLNAGEGLSPASHAELVKILAVGSGGYLRRGVPAGVQVLSKSGELEGVRVDAATVRLERPYAIAVMTTYLKDEADGERAITSVSRAVYDYFSRLAAGSEYGRQVKRPSPQLRER
jgi:beta-lactamase class A